MVDYYYGLNSMIQIRCLKGYCKRAVVYTIKSTALESIMFLSNRVYDIIATQNVCLLTD